MRNHLIIIMCTLSVDVYLGFTGNNQSLKGILIELAFHTFYHTPFCLCVYYPCMCGCVFNIHLFYLGEKNNCAYSVYLPLRLWV